MSDKVVRKISKTPICGIYQVTNKLNNKIYIGQSIDIERRWNQHMYGKGSVVLKNAIKKYGLDVFEFKILEEIDFTTKNEVINILTELEQKWFDIKKPYLNGYNINKTSKPNLTKSRDNNFGDKISKIKIDNNHTGKPIKQYNLNGGFIRNWKSAAEVERCLGFKAENVSACCLKKQNSSNYFIWRFENDELLDVDVQKANKSLRLSKVRQYNLKGELIKIYENVKDASNKTNISPEIIRNTCNGHQKTGGGYIWKFKNEPLYLLDHINNYPKIYQFNFNGELMKTWNSIHEIHLPNTSITNMKKQIIKCCKNLIPFYKDCLWSYNNKIEVKNRKPSKIIMNIIQKDLNDNIIKIWRSLEEVSRETQYSRYKIKKCCLNELNHYNGYKWEWGS
jgi:group I intron endonuclease